MYIGFYHSGKYAGNTYLRDVKRKYPSSSSFHHMHVQRCTRVCIRTLLTLLGQILSSAIFRLNPLVGLQQIITDLIGIHAVYHKWTPHIVMDLSEFAISCTVFHCFNAFLLRPQNCVWIICACLLALFSNHVFLVTSPITLSLLYTVPCMVSKRRWQESYLGTTRASSVTCM